MTNANDSAAQREHERENANREYTNPASEEYDKKRDGPNRPAE